MCVIIHKPADVQLDLEIFKEALRINRDGWGMSVLPAPQADDQTVLTLWGHQDDRALRLVEIYKDLEFVFHARIGTAGVTQSLLNLHPFEILKGQLYLAHNGHFHQLSHLRSVYSDTWRLAEHLKPFFEKYGLDLLEQDFFQGFMKLLCGASNKLAFITPQKVYIVNEDGGVNYQGAWFSNSGPLPYSRNYVLRGFQLSNADEENWDWEEYWKARDGKSQRRQRQHQTKKSNTVTGETSDPVALPPAKDEAEAISNMTKVTDELFDHMKDQGVLATHPFPPSNEEGTIIG